MRVPPSRVGGRSAGFARTALVIADETAILGPALASVRLGQGAAEVVVIVQLSPGLGCFSILGAMFLSRLRRGSLHNNTLMRGGGRAQQRSGGQHQQDRRCGPKSRPDERMAAVGASLDQPLPPWAARRQPAGEAVTDALAVRRIGPRRLARRRQSQRDRLDERIPRGLVV